MEIVFSLQVKKAFVKSKFIHCDIHSCIEWVEIQSSTVANVLSRTGLLLFGTFELAIFMPFKVGKFCIPQKKALLPIV